jgi:titin
LNCIKVKGKVRARSCKVIWNPPEFTGGSPIISYELEMDGGSGYQSVYRGEATEFLFDELQPGTTYRMRVAGVTAGGVGDYSETCFVNTDPVVPGPPSPPQLVDKPKVCFLLFATS